MRSRLLRRLVRRPIDADHAEMAFDPQQDIREKPPVLRERQDRAVRDAPTELPFLAEVWTRPWTGLALSATLPGLFLGLIGPFGSFGAPLWMRLAYWMPTMAIGAVLGAALTMTLERVILLRSRPLLRAATTACAMTAFMTLVAYGGGYLVFGPNTVRLSWTLAFYVWVITMVMVFVVGAARAKREYGPVIASAPPTPIQMSNAQAPSGPKLTARMAPKFKTATIIALEAEDHYVRVHTDQGADLLLMRLADAIAEMGEVEGARTHRSWWIARAAVKGVRRADGRATLTLTNGVEAPVSRNETGKLEEQGWL